MNRALEFPVTLVLTETCIFLVHYEHPQVVKTRGPDGPEALT